MKLQYQHRLGLILFAIVLSTAAHFVLPDYSHGLHVVHIVLAGTFLIPILAAAIWLDFKTLLSTTALISLIYFTYMRVKWSNHPMENANQWAFIAGYWVIAFVAGTLIRQNRVEQARHRLAQQVAERKSTIEALDGLSAVLRARDEYTQEHSRHVSDLAGTIAEAKGLPAEKVELVRLAGLVHDLGKVGVRDDVLFKPGVLTEEERKAIEQHPIVAAEIIAKIPAARPIADIVIAHHECPDGSGYPCHLKEEAIPGEARVLRVADVFCSLVEERPYKPGMGVEAAISLMQEWAGTKIDSAGFAALLQILPEYRKPSGGAATASPV